MIPIILVLLTGFADLYRGAKAGLPRALEKVLLGALALTILAGFSAFSSWYVVAYLVCFSIGASISWGAVIGASLRKDTPETFQKEIEEKKDGGDWYLKGWFAKTPMRGLFARSILWGLLAGLPLLLWLPPIYAVAMLLTYSVIMPLSVKFLHLIEDSKFDKMISNLCLKLVDKNHRWPRHELYRGWLTGIILAACALLI